MAAPGSGGWGFGGGHGRGRDGGHNSWNRPLLGIPPPSPVRGSSGSGGGGGGGGVGGVLICRGSNSGGSGGGSRGTPRCTVSSAAFNAAPPMSWGLHHLAVHLVSSTLLQCYLLLEMLTVPSPASGYPSNKSPRCYVLPLVSLNFQSRKMAANIPGSSSAKVFFAKMRESVYYLPR